MKAPKLLDKITDTVLNYQPKAKSDKAKKRKRKARKIHGVAANVLRES